MPVLNFCFITKNTLKTIDKNCRGWPNTFDFFIYIYIYIYRDRERERERDLMKGDGFKQKKQEADDIPLKLLQTQTMEIILCCVEIHIPKLNYRWIIWSKQQKVLASTWTRTIPSSCVLIKKFLHSKWWFSEISIDVHVSWQQHLIYWKRCYYIPSEGVDSYQ